MDVAKLIRTIGYIVYTIIWSPIVILALVSLPIVALALCWGHRITLGVTFKCMANLLKKGYAHDMKFINEGVWD